MVNISRVLLAVIVALLLALILQSVARAESDCSLLAQARTTEDIKQIARFVGSAHANPVVALHQVAMQSTAPCPMVDAHQVAQQAGIWQQWTAYMQVLNVPVPTSSAGQVEQGYAGWQPTPTATFTSEPSQARPVQRTYQAQTTQATPTRWFQSQWFEQAALFVFSVIALLTLVWNRGWFDVTSIKRKVNGYSDTQDFEVPESEVQPMATTRQAKPLTNNVSATPSKRRRKANSIFAAYAKEEATIQKLLHNDRQTGFRINKGAKVLITPKTVVYPLQMARGAVFTKLDAALEPLAAKLYDMRSRQGYTDQVNAIAMRQPLSLIVPRVDPKTLTWSDRRSPGVSRHMLTGLSYATGRPEPLFLNLDSALQFSVLLGGTSGSGKSTLLNGMVLSACEASDPDDFQFMAIDIGRKHFTAFEKLPHCTGFAHTLDGALAMLQYIEEQMSGPEDKYTARVAVVIDEIQKLTKCGVEKHEKEFKRLLMMIASNGRAYGYSIIISTQKPNAGTVPTDVRDNCVSRIAGRCKSHSQSEMILGDKRTEAVQLTGAGSFVVDDGNNTQIVYSYMLDTQKEIDAICRSWDGLEKTFIDFEGEHDEPASVDVPEEIAEVFEEYDRGDGTMRRGWKGKAIDALSELHGRSYTGRYNAEGMSIIEEFLDAWRR